MRFAPIVMFVYNRADHFEKTVLALSECTEAKHSELYIFSDSARNSAEESSVAHVRALAHKIENGNLFQKVIISESETNKGLAQSVILGVTEVITQHGRAIVVEDDCVPSPFFLKYMNSCLNYFENNQKIGAVAGYAPPIRFPDNYNNDIFTAYRSCSWGWATWKDRWENVDWELTSINELYHDPCLLNKLNSNGEDRFLRLYRQTKANKNSWSVKFGYHLIRLDMLTIYPRYSYIDNIGCDDTGVHSKAGDDVRVRVDLSKAIENPTIEDIEIDERIQKEMKHFYSAGIVSNFKRIIATKAIVFIERIKNK